MSRPPPQPGPFRIQPADGCVDLVVAPFDRRVQLLVDAVDRPIGATTGALVWDDSSPQPMRAASTTSSAKRLFTGELSGHFLAIDARDGSVLFRHNAGTPHNGGIGTYAIEDTQYIAMMAGNTNPLWPNHQSSASVIIYRLP
ncbi:MAG: PQQ-binding-like beta-propeller repeat protein [Acidobacteriota bacterium]|nr:PQQ-binding-like beta-propeller repeat protein [Acidobacteriota bacterium]